MSESRTPMYKNDYGIVVRGYESRLGGLYKSEDVALRVGKETDPVHALVRFSDVVHAFVDLKAATHNEVAAWSLVAEIREALGDNGKRMQQELIEWCKKLASAESDLAAAQARIAELEAEANEHARLLGMSGEREARLLARIAEIEAERDRLRALLAGLQETYAACLSPQMCQAIDAALAAKEKS